MNERCLYHQHQHQQVTIQGILRGRERQDDLGNRGLKMILTTSVSLEKGDGTQNSIIDTALTKNFNNHKASTRND